MLWFDKFLKKFLQKKKIECDIKMEIHANVDYCGTKCIFLDPFADRKKKSLNSQAAFPVTL